VSLDEKRQSRTGKLSGGQRQRLAIACALVGNPDLLFLDEPTTGLDPQARLQLWELITSFRARGGTVLLTTHYMEEAERLCDRVAIMDHGHIIALGTPADLIASLGAEQIVEFAVEEPLRDMARLNNLPGVVGVREAGGRYLLTVSQIPLALPALLGEIDNQQAKLATLLTHHATLEDVFVALTGRTLRDG
jgi:ABC-2 type transport system ATP-binding protein